MTHRYDIEGHKLGIPYDWRMPSKKKILARIWSPGGPMFPPKVFGWGWTLNLAHWGTWLLLATVTIAAFLLI